jgi:hypothetical protein
MTAAAKKQTKAEPQQPASTAQAPQAPKPMAAAPTAQPQPPTANKQSQTVAKLKAAWTEKGIKLDQLTEKPDGKFVLLQPTPQWPVIRIGPTGGIELPQIRSYAKALDCATDGLAAWQKQQARDAKKTAPPPPPVAGAVKPQPAPVAKPESPAAKKARKDAALESALA